MTIESLKVAAVCLLVQLLMTTTLVLLPVLLAVAFEMNEHKLDNFLYRSYLVETLTSD